MNRYELESKTNKLFILLKEIEDANNGDEDIAFSVACLKDHTQTLMQIAEDYPVYSTTSHVRRAA